MGRYGTVLYLFCTILYGTIGTVQIRYGTVWYGTGTAGYRTVCLYTTVLYQSTVPYRTGTLRGYDCTYNP